MGATKSSLVKIRQQDLGPDLCMTCAVTEIRKNIAEYGIAPWHAAVQMLICTVHSQSELGEAERFKDAPKGDLKNATLFTISEVTDTDVGYYKIGEVEQGIYSGVVAAYIEAHGPDRLLRRLAALSHDLLTWYREARNVEEDTACAAGPGA